MVSTSMKAKFPKISAKVITYRNIKKGKDMFRKDLAGQLNKMSSNTYIDFETAFINTLEKHAPEKKKPQES